MSFSMNKIETNYTKTLSDYVENLKYEDIPAEVFERAKMIALQTIGVSIGAKKVPIAENANTLGLQMNGGEGGKATAWITGDKMCAANASLVNGTLADALDWEDCSWTGHPSASIIPVVWAMAEEYKKSGKDFLTAIVAAYEVYQRISMVVQPPKDWDVFKGWGLTSWQVFGGTVAACKILGLDSDKVNQALGISAIVSVIPSVLAHNTMSESLRRNMILNRMT